MSRASALIDPSDRLGLERAVVEAREHGAADVTVAVVRACDSYESAPWRCGVLLAALVGLGLAAFAAPPTPLEWLGALAVALAAGLALARVEPVRRWFVSPALLEARARERAEQLLAEQAGAAEPRSAVLLFVALFERRVMVLAGDAARRGLAPGRSWSEIADPVRDGLRRGQLPEGLGTALERCGDLLALPLAAGEAAPERIPRLVVLED